MREERNSVRAESSSCCLPSLFIVALLVSLKKGLNLLGTNLNSRLVERAKGPAKHVVRRQFSIGQSITKRKKVNFVKQKKYWRWTEKGLIE